MKLLLVGIFFLFIVYYFLFEQSFSKNLNPKEGALQYFSSNILPKYVLFIRHGEKSSDKTNYFLDDQGLQRAQKLVRWITTIVPYKYGANVSQLFTTLPQSNAADYRPSQTISFTAGKTGIPVNIPGYAKDSKNAYKKFIEISKSNQDINTSYLFCWEHTCMSNLVSKFPLNRSTKIPYWNDDDFSTVYVLTLDPSTNKYNLNFDCENLLVDDEKICSQQKIYKKQKCKGI
jgi:hypothetical protein